MSDHSKGEVLERGYAMHPPISSKHWYFLMIWPYHLERRLVQPENLLDEVSRKDARPIWSKVRWVIVSGLSFSTLRPLADAFVEAILRVPRRPNLEQYRNGVFATLPLCTSFEPLRISRNEVSVPISTNNMDCNVPDGSDEELLAEQMDVHDEQTYYERQLVMQMQDRDRQVAVFIEEVSMFLAQDGACISHCVSLLMDGLGVLLTFFDSAADVICGPLIRRLQSEQSLIRQEHDASFLMQTVMDAVVDHSFPLLVAYQNRLRHLEDDLLYKPRTDSMIFEVNSLRKTLAPIQDVLVDFKEQPALQDPALITDFAKTYASDILDNMKSICEDLDDLKEQIGSLMDIVFNLVGQATNDSAYQLTLVNMIFFPATFLTGVYGTGFEYFEELHTEEGVWYMWRQIFWVTLVTLAIFFWPQIWKWVKARVGRWQAKMALRNKVGVRIPKQRIIK